MSKFVLNVKYLLLLSFLTAAWFYNLGHYLLTLLVYMDLEPPALKYLSSALNCQKTRNQYCQGEKVNGNCFRYFLLPGFLFNHSKTTYKVASFKCIEV